jgi:single-strand DNA-binding protein
MANSYNKIILVGNLGRDGELRATPQGKQVLSTSLAVEDPSKKDDRGRPGTEWYRIKVWGRQAETLSPHLLKGKSILVEGRLSIQTWTDREGHNRYTPEVSADRIVDELDQAPADINADDIPF